MQVFTDKQMNARSFDKDNRMVQLHRLS